MFYIRLAHEADISSIAQFNQALALESENLQLDASILLKGVSAVIADAKKGFYLVAHNNEEIIGSLLITYEWSDWRNTMMWWLQSVYVVPAFRGQGVFTALLQAVELEAKNNACQLLRLYMEHDNQRAAKAYARNGFEQTHYLVYEKSIG